MGEFNAFRMWGSYPLAILLGIVGYISAGLSCGGFWSPTYCTVSPFTYIFTTLAFAIPGFLIGWGIHSIFRWANNNDKKGIVSIIFGVVVLIIIGMFSVTTSFLSLNYFGSLPAHVYAGGNLGQYACGEISDKYSANYASVYGDYRVKANVNIMTQSSQWEGFGDSREFILSVWLGRYWVGGFDPKGYPIDEGLPPQVRCDGTLDCSYGFTTEQWVLKEGKCFVKPICNEGEDKCVAKNLNVCEDGRWKDKGIVIDECNVECISDSDCSKQVLSSFCSGKDLSTRVVLPACSFNYCSDIASTEVETCEFSCGVVDEVPQCIESKPIFQDPTFLIIGGIILLIGIGGVVWWFRRR